jgi:hypothetical protein
MLDPSLVKNVEQPKEPIGFGSGDKMDKQNQLLKIVESVIYNVIGGAIASLLIGLLL